MKTIISILSVTVFLSFLSCTKDNTEFPDRKNVKLKRKLSYHWAQDTVPYLISEYEYDSRNRVIRIQDNYGAQLFKYNNNGQLTSKYGYDIDTDGSTLKDTTHYSYENEQLIFEELITLPPKSYPYSFQTKYEYENSKLIRKTKYRDHVFEGLTIYEYSGDLCSKELYFRDSTAVQIDSYRSFSYDKSKLLMSTLVGFAAREQKYMLQTVYYIYDDSGNLIIEDAIQNMEISAWISYCYRYEYD